MQHGVKNIRTPNRSLFFLFLFLFLVVGNPVLRKIHITYFVPRFQLFQYFILLFNNCSRILEEIEVKGSICTKRVNPLNANTTEWWNTLNNLSAKALALFKCVWPSILMSWCLKSYDCCVVFILLLPPFNNSVLTSANFLFNFGVFESNLKVDSNIELTNSHWIKTF